MMDTMAVLVAAAAGVGVWLWWRRRSLYLNVGGAWRFDVRDDATACGEGVATYQRVATIAQDGHNLELTDGVAHLEGVIHGRHVALSGTWLEDGGTTTEMVEATVTARGLSGSSTWTWRGRGTSCSGASTFTALRAHPVTTPP